MSFLTPLYLLGALAIALPILAHLIRRTPPRRQEFSSVQFLTPSLPKVTRRSRIEHWALLCLRALVISLLALAFARPLWRTSIIADQPPQSRWAAVLLDTSASLRRDGLWDEARAQLDVVLREFDPGDHVGVFVFDREPALVWSWDAWTQQDPARRPAVVAAALNDVRPTWYETNLGAALIEAAESLDAVAGAEAGGLRREIVVISDLQAGSRLDALLGYAWPEEIPVRLVRIGADVSPDNAGMQPAGAADASPRVRVMNADLATSETFSLQWSVPQDHSDLPAAAEVVVPAGQSRIVRAPPLESDESHGMLFLHGDAHPFDNACYIAVPQRQEFTVAYIGDDDPNDPAGQRFYIEPLFADTPQRDVTVVDWKPQAPLTFEVQSPLRLVVVTGAAADDQLGPLRDFVNSGGLLIDVLGSESSAAGLAELLGVASIRATEADVAGFSLLTDIDFAHPALAPFADPKFSDFTTLHFWKHRTLDEAAVPGLRVLARFDDGDVAIGEVRVGAGRVVFFTSGWSRTDSQLAVWSKFVPLMNGLLDSFGGVAPETMPLTVGDEIPWQAVRRDADATARLVRPDGSEVALLADEKGTVAELPGQYAVMIDGDPDPVAQFAVNLSASESETAPLADDQLESLGIGLAAGERAAEESPAARQSLENSEIEQRQRLWRWVLLAVVVLLMIETVWAGWLTRRSPAAG